MDKNKVTILLVDDDKIILDTLGGMIEYTGWKCITSPTGEIAIDALKINDVSAVILDVNLPAMNGFDVLKKIKEIKPHVPVIMLTSIGSEKENIEKAVKLGASGFVSKAMPVKQTISNIKKVLGL